eukprot:CAMPEP_0181190516 /NCGR_PEP_ID=MMETSP1096-20121128/12236_1 /TAXON_ID=156174 ORGANISM="Chrysochromulina ericina, Strain CCMP281" /NCGR_SAMPLE_ID=MMETSP1096 /ASSEMBLY_ACC=CAM_ASM_000453 /LENGTH=76 /DNA_ID=CAMNT_0023279739 /DNA_START=143 /DNA_END=373 /DNA_ORIENTATION=-
MGGWVYWGPSDHHLHDRDGRGGDGSGWHPRRICECSSSPRPKGQDHRLFGHVANLRVAIEVQRAELGSQVARERGG